VKLEDKRSRDEVLEYVVYTDLDEWQEAWSHAPSQSRFDWCIATYHHVYPLGGKALLVQGWADHIVALVKLLLDRAGLKAAILLIAGQQNDKPLACVKSFRVRGWE
jgi:hypothetical protein